MDTHTQSLVEIIASLEKRLVALEARGTRLIVENTQLRQLYERAPLAYQSLDNNGCFIEVNQSWLETLGYTREEVIGRNFSEFLHPDWQDHFQENFPKFKAIGEILGIEFEMVRKDGSTILVSFHGKIGKDLAGHFQQTHCIFHNITEHKKAEDALRLRESYFSAIIENQPGLLWLKDRNSRFLVVNTQFAKSCGFKDPELLVGKSDLDVWPEELANKYIADDLAILKSGKPLMVEEPILDKGEIKWFETFKTPVFDYQGIAIGTTGYARDITERKRAEEAVRESEERFRMAMDATKDGLWDWDISSGNVYYSPGYWLMLGYDVDTRPQSVEAWTELIYPEDKEAVLAANNDCIENRSETFLIEYRMRANDGNWKWIQGRGKAVKRGKKGHALRMIGTHINITERKQIEKLILVMNEDLERKVQLRTQELQETQKQVLHAEKLSAIGQLSASIAHEFNNPLQGILSVLNGLKKRAILEDEDKELLVGAISEGNRIKDLIRSLQDFHRPTSSRKASMDVHRSLDLILLLNKSDFKARRISVECDYAEGLPQIHAVPDQIKQVFLNLLTNAADACPSGGKITVSTSQKDDKVAVMIKDTGIGIKPSDMEQIFRPFFTTKPEVKGTGLGLSTSYGIVKNHHGEIQVESKPGEGTTFTVLLPIVGGDESIS